jgi:uncharacterized protein
LTLPAQPSGPVNDYAHALTPVQVSQLDAQLRGWERGSTQQIAIAIFQSLDGESVEDVSMRLAEAWKIGGKKSNDGVLLTLFLDDHKLRIEVGYGLEDKLTDALSARIIRDVMVPKLKQNDVYDAVYSGVGAIHDIISDGKVNLPPEKQSSLPIGWIVLGVIFLALLIFSSGFRSVLWVILNILGSMSGGSGGTGGSGGWSSGGSGGSWSGGGGSFGGGGASGSW